MTGLRGARPLILTIIHNLNTEPMTKKHFNELARRYNEILTGVRTDCGEYAAIRVTILATMDVIGTTNPNFDRERFLRACGIPQANNDAETYLNKCRTTHTSRYIGKLMR